MRIKFNPSIRGASGTMGEWVYYELAGQPVARRKAVFKDKRTPAQLAHRDKVKRAAAWSRKTMADPKQRADYSAACQGHQTPFNIGFRDFMTPPKIDGIEVAEWTGKAGQRILIRASDDFEVNQVLVAVADAEGKKIEDGKAKKKGDVWEYTTQTEMAAGKAVLVEVTAMDRPGNKTQSRCWQYLPPS